MDNPATQQQNLADLSLVVRESSLKRFRAVPAGMENWRITPESMSIADLAHQLIRADEWLLRKIADPTTGIITGNPGEVTIMRRENCDSLVTRLVETGERRAELFRKMTDDELVRRIPDDHYGGAQTALFGGFLCVRT